MKRYDNMAGFLWFFSLKQRTEKKIICSKMSFLRNEIDIPGTTYFTEHIL